MIQPWNKQDTRIALSLEVVYPTCQSCPALEMPGALSAVTPLGCEASCCCLRLL